MAVDRAARAVVDRPVRRAAPWGMRDRFRFPVVVLLTLAALLAACSGEGSESPEEGAGAEDMAGDEGLRDEPAPAAVDEDDDGVAVRVDEVSRDGHDLDIRFTLATTEERRFDDSDVRVLTDTGIELPPPPEQERTLSAGALATVGLSFTDVTEAVSELRLEVEDVEVTFEVPENDGTFRWQPAPLRQVGFTDGLMRDDSRVVMVPYTFRTQGLVSEVTFHALAQSYVDPSLCGRSIHPCHLEGPSGQTYPLVGKGYEFPEFGQVRGTLRFLGEIPADVDELRLVVNGSGGSLGVPDPQLEHRFTVPSAEDSALRVAADDTLPEPVDVGLTVDGGEGLRIELGRMSFAEDRIQLEVRASGAEDGRRLNRDTRLIDPSGFEHRMLGPREDRSMRITEGETIEATLVFLSRLGPDTTQLELRFDDEFGATIEIPTTGEER